MKADIDSFGNMTISGETSTEHYALRKFWEDWQAHKVALGIFVPDDSGVFTEKPLRSEP